MNEFYLIGLTGNLGCGKSTVRRMLEQMGARGIDADLLGHAAMERGTRAWNEIIKTFGPDILRYDGEIDRQSLGKRVFGNPEALGRLEGIIHPAVGELVKQALRDNENPVVVLEAVKLVESGLDRWCDGVWVVTCTSEDQVQRVVRDRNMRPEDARARLSSQSAQEDKARVATVVIDNSGDVENTRAQVRKAWGETVRPERARDKSAWLLEAKPTSKPTPQPPTVKVARASSPPAAPAPKPAGVPTAPERPVQPTPASPPAPAPQPEHLLQPEAPAVSQVEKPTEKQEPRPQPPAPKETAPAIPLVQVRPARRSDLDTLSIALAKSEGSKEPLSKAETLKRLGERGYRIALAQGRIVALASWEAENLVAITRGIWAESPESARASLPPLLALIEQDANGLVCEVSVLLLDSHTPLLFTQVAGAAGYRVGDMNVLHKVWRQVIAERLKEGDKVLVKPLRKELITKPVG